MKQGSGLIDKLYWRPIGYRYHCFEKEITREGRTRFAALCGNAVRVTSGGQACSRPAPVLRCGRCDNLEMDRRGWAESGPATA